MLGHTITVIISFIFGNIVGYYIKLKAVKLIPRDQIKEISDCLITQYNRSHKAKLTNNPETSKLILFLINLDDYRGIIEAFGYNFSTKVVTAIYLRLREYAKSNHVKLYRFGIDEYILFSLNQLSAPSQIINEANKLLNLVAIPMNINHNSINLTASIGISIFLDHSTDSNTLLRNAELALLNAKKSGKNTYSFYAQDLTDQIIDRTIIKNDLLTALHNNELQLVWQPQMDLSHNNLIGAEALIRWKHVVRGNLSPELFINIAESTGLIWQVGAWIIHNACIQCKQILETCKLTDFKVAVNLSSGQFLQGDVVQEIATNIYATGINPANFEVEITESMFMRDQEKSIFMISVLNSMGIKIAIDDFGTGYSSFGRLCQLNFNCLKIDKSFIKNITSDPKSYAIVGAMISMAKSLNIKVVAEGVETEDQASLLKKIGCDFIQGYFVSPPLDLAAFINFATTKHKN